MGFVLKLRRKGLKKRPYYDIIVTNQTQGFTGKNIRKVGFVRDLDTKVIIYLDRLQLSKWIIRGAVVKGLRLKQILKYTL